MKISDYKGEDGIKLLAEILDPATEIIADPKIKEAASGNVSRLEIAKMLLKEHSKSIVAILATLAGETPETYSRNIFEMTRDLLEIINDKEIVDFFTLQAQTTGVTSFGSALANTEDSKE